MCSRSACTAALALAIGLFGTDAAHAQGQLNLSVGLFAVRGEDGRVDGDVLVENRELFLFDFKDFNTISFGAEYLVRSANISRLAAASGSTHEPSTRFTTTTCVPTEPRSNSS